MLEILSHDFMVRAIIAGLVCAVLAGVVGNFLVAAKHSVTSEMVAHTALGGVGIGFFLQTSPVIVAIAFSLFTVVMLYFMTEKNREAIAVTLLTGGVAIALLFTHLGKNNPFSLHGFLFGSILTLTDEEVVGLILFAGISLLFIALFWNRFISVIFDRDFYANQLPKRSKKYELILLLMSGFLIAASLKVIGSLLISALLVIPVVTAQLISQSFKGSVGWSIFFNCLGVLFGLFGSYYFDIPASSGIVLTLIGFFLSISFYKKLRR